jgi:hypothetical protein
VKAGKGTVSPGRTSTILGKHIENKSKKIQRWNNRLKGALAPKKRYSYEFPEFSLLIMYTRPRAEMTNSPIGKQHQQTKYPENQLIPK